jgi:hypothetical protein
MGAVSLHEILAHAQLLPLPLEPSRSFAQLLCFLAVDKQQATSQPALINYNSHACCPPFPADSLNGRVWLPALPHLANFPHPDDVSLSLLLAPGLFPLKAEAAVSPVGSGSSAAPTAAGAVAASSASKASSTRPSKKAISGSGPAGTTAKAAGAAALSPRAVPDSVATAGTAPGAQHKRWGLLRLFGRPGGHQEGGPVELEVRVEGKGLHTVTRAWLETGLPASDRGGEGSGERQRPLALWALLVHGTC